MKTIKILTFVVALALAAPAQAQTADEIISTYFENIGGLENFKQLEGMKLEGNASQQGFEFPFTVLQLKDGRQMFSFTFQGKKIKQGVFDGEILWNTNFMTMKAEKSDAEQTANFKLNTNDFPDSFVDYKEKGYTVELLGNETMDGAETFKIKLVKEPITVDGVQEDDVSFYYFDTENYVPIAVESVVREGPAKGKTAKTIMSDYQEVEGLYFPFSTSQYVDGNLMFSMTMDNVELNPTVDDAEFAFPEEIAEEKK
ncbi:outer membrane lipoprotein-sorting protein [Allomuricauda sp. SCSIO 65647]|uniref:outer membrane lipoprotein-sorting protein n=1 Tax=Allomuricauda sp. SCSIO 65647 TaxID=2908843 RepID=UPI001F23B994|nr:outer membrane lipoprotein-sorting protein [Muricauda sp. SCSIO 65647]UJH67274.1 outer membrane lipoprotein-sorting protein [Muricauda sp. SCSIO 65647]